MVDPRAEAVAVLLTDQPGADRGVIDTVIEAWRRTRDRIMLVSYRGREGHPLVFAQALFGQLAALQGDKAAWKIVDAHPEWIGTVLMDRPAPRDINTWQEYEAVLRDGGGAKP
jgi:molybdenum cofactor cytidylyltransferase